jgi:elongation factor 2
LKDLEEDFANVSIIRSPSVVSFRETVTATSRVVCLSKFTNKLDRLKFQAASLEDTVVAAIEANEMTLRMNQKTRAKELQNRFGWEQTDSHRVWSFGPDSEGLNLIVDTRKSAEYLQDILEQLIGTFQSVSKQGLLCEEPL